MNTYDPIEYGKTQYLRCRRSFQSFVVPKNTMYEVDNVAKDPIGVSLVMQTNQRVVIEPGSTVYLTDKAYGVLNDNSIPIPFFQNDQLVMPNDVLMVFQGRTKCTI